MAKRISDEERIMGFFRNADLACANTLYRVVAATMKERNAIAPATEAKPVRRRRARRIAVPQATGEPTVGV